jgi:heme A synthase
MVMAHLSSFARCTRTRPGGAKTSKAVLRRPTREYQGDQERKERDVLWFIVLLLVLIALIGGWTVSKLLLALLIVALVVALFGAFGRTA